ncbi:MAG: hypothetical protein IJ033_03085 [Clostridia bacterium]|nr:hypothetical protein [Clostridia bacterium]
MKKNAPKILAVVLLSLIAVLMIVAGSGSLKEVFTSNAPTNNGADTVPSVDASGDDNAQNTPPNTAAPPQQEEIINYFPILAQKDGTYRFKQDIALENSTLHATHSTADGIFLVVSHATTQGAFKVDSTTQTVIAMDEDGTLTGAISLSTQSDCTYLASKVTTDGMVVIVTNGSRTYVYTISLDLTRTEVMELPAFTGANLFSLSDGFLFFGRSTENTVYKIKQGAVLSSNSLQTGEIKAVYDFSSYYALFISGINGYSFLKLDGNLKLISTITIPNRTLLAIEPIVVEKEQHFIAVEQTPSGVEIAKYPMSFSIEKSERVGVGLAESADVFMNGESIFLLLHSSTDRLYLVDKNLSFTSSSVTTMQGITKLYDCYATSLGYKVLYAKGEKLTLLDIRNDGTSQSLNLDTVTNIGNIAIDTDDKFMVAYQTENGIVAIGIN